VPDLPPLEVADVTDYGALARSVREALEGIAARHPNAQFHLVSGLPQARLVFGLSLFAQILKGVLWEVRDPGPDEQDLTRTTCERRLKEWPTYILVEFRELLRRRFDVPRLVLNVSLRRASLDGRSLGLRGRSTRAAPDRRHRAFEVLAMLAARRLYGAGRAGVARRLICQTVYAGVESPEKQLSESIGRLNDKARRISMDSGRGVIRHLVERAADEYRLTEQLGAGGEFVLFEDLASLKQLMGEYMSADALRTFCPELSP
jgi:hypothetical protein